jgi:hypothetical protein
LPQEQEQELLFRNRNGLPAQRVAPRPQRKGLALTLTSQQKKTGGCGVWWLAGRRQKEQGAGWRWASGSFFFAALRFSRLPKTFGQTHLIYRTLLIHGGEVAQRQRRPSNLPAGSSIAVLLAFGVGTSSPSPLRSYSIPYNSIP